MIGTTLKLLRSAMSRILFTRLGWGGCALALLAMFALLHVLGWRDDTAIISGTFASGSPDATSLRGLLYALAYFAAVLVSPILLLAAGIDALLPGAMRCGTSR